MDTQVILTRFDQQMRREIQYPDMRKDVLSWGVRFVRPAPGMSVIADYRLNDMAAETIIQEQIDYFRSLKQPFTWKVYEHDRPSDIKDHLQAAGFEPDDPGTIMVLELGDLPVDLQSPIVHDIRPVARREQLGDVIQVLEQVWGGNFGWVWQRLGDHLEIPGYLSIYVGYVNDQPSTVGWTYFHPGIQFGSLFGGSTVAGQRGKGLYTAILARRVQEALARDVLFLVVETTEMSQPIVARNGFNRISAVQDFEWRAD